MANVAKTKKVDEIEEDQSEEEAMETTDSESASAEENKKGEPRNPKNFGEGGPRLRKSQRRPVGLVPDLSALVINAVKQLAAVREKRLVSHLFSDDENFELLLCVQQEVKMPLAAHTIPLPVKHSIYPPDTEICLITFPPQRRYKDLCRTIPQIRKVVDTNKLKQKFKTIEARNMLLKGFQLFLADRKTIPKLRKLLGKTLWSRRRPVPMKLTVNARPETIQQTVNYLLRHTPLVVQDRSRNMTIKIGRTSSTPEEIAQNVQSVLTKICSVLYFEKGMDSIVSLHIRLPRSPSIPIYLSPITATAARSRPKAVEKEKQPESTEQQSTNTKNSKKKPNERQKKRK